ncbi:MAG: hypothetical protein R3C14_40460 [Caldilineaceae bacterium]
MDSTFLLHFHSGWRYLVILVLVAAIIKFLIGWLAKQHWSQLDQILGAATPIMIDIQWLLGLILWVLQQRWNGAVPLASWEHPFTMTLVLAISHVGWSRVKKSPNDRDKYRIGTVSFVIAGLLLGLGVARITHTI